LRHSHDTSGLVCGLVELVGRHTLVILVYLVVWHALVSADVPGPRPVFAYLNTYARHALKEVVGELPCDGHAGKHQTLLLRLCQGTEGGDGHAGRHPTFLLRLY
jgi:hypothetical protein